MEYEKDPEWKNYRMMFLGSYRVGDTIEPIN